MLRLPIYWDSGQREREGERESTADLFLLLHVHVGGYSAIGWNHPGFGDSSVSFRDFVDVCSSFHVPLASEQGLPLPAQEFNAIDVVIRYAVSGLGFELEKIILYAWSIGNSYMYMHVHFILYMHVVYSQSRVLWSLCMR